MEHVSTLCAISTVGIAATGFALGHPEHASRPGKFQRKTLSLRDRPSLPTNTELTSGIRSPTPPRTSQATFPPSGLDSYKDDYNSSRGEKDLNPPKSASGLRTRRRCQTYTNPPLQLAEDQQVNFHARRPSSSWLRRLSIASFQTESVFSNPGPLSPSFHGSSSPGLSRPNSQRRAPNKLVKRSLSQHPNADPLRISHRASTPPISRRPATSYQRSETFRHRTTHSLTFEPNLDALSPSSEVEEKQHSENSRLWRPLFNARPDGLPGRLVRRLSTAGRQKDQVLRRILPNADSPPTLLLGTSITNQTSATSTEWGRSNSSHQPVQFRDPFRSDSSLFPAGEKTGANVPSTCLEEPEPGRSAAKANIADVEPGNDSVSPVERSASLRPFNDQSEPGKTVMGFPHTNKTRLNFPESSSPRVSRANSEIMPATSLAPEASEPRRRIISFPLSRDAKANMGCRRDGAKRPSSSDAITPPLFQYGFDRQSCLNCSPHLRQRSRRHSVAASDPASTVIGSDDTRIFTSGEEDETDFLSDTAFDSIRTHITTNSGSVYGPRIETIFDKNHSAALAKEESTKLEDLITHGKIVSKRPEQEPPTANAHKDYALASPNPLQKTVEKSTVNKRDSFSSGWSDEDAPSLVRNEVLSPNSVSDIRLVGDGFHRHPIETLETYPKMNIFDWSEQSRNDREASGAEARPRTVHGKHANEARGCRMPGRKAPSFLHLRSQSVPNARESGPSNESRKTSGKFGTWGLGSKGVSEDWDGDFDFDDADDNAASEHVRADENNRRREMIVPQSIMERQDSLHGQFGLVQELTLLVEELKRLRQQAAYLDIVHGPTDELWKEAEGIINLATIDEEDNRSPPRSPSSLTFSFDDSEEDSSKSNNASKRDSGESWQASLLERTNSNSQPSPGVRRSSTPKAKFVLDMVSRRASHDTVLPTVNAQRSHKLPFDTQSLHDLVIRAGVVTRSLKEVIRNAEAVTATPEEDLPPSDPPFRRIFDEPSNDNLSDFQTPCLG